MAEAVKLTSVRRLIDDTRSTLASWEQVRRDARDDVRATNDQLARLKDAIKQYVSKASSPAYNSSHVSGASEVCDCIIADINTLLVDSKYVEWGLTEKLRMTEIRKRLEASMWYFTCPSRTVGNANRPPPMNPLPQVLPRPAPPRQPAQRQPHQQNWQLPLPNQHPIPPRPEQAQEQHQCQRNIPRQPFQRNGQPPLNQRPIPPQAQQAQGQQQNWGNRARQPYSRNGQPPLNQHPIPPQPFQQAQGQPYYGNGQPPILPQPPVPPQHPVPPRPPQQACRPNQGIKMTRQRTWPQQAQVQQTQPSKPEPTPAPVYTLHPQLPQQEAEKCNYRSRSDARRKANTTWGAPPQVAEGYKHAIRNNTGFVSRREPNPPILNGGYRQQNPLGVPNNNPSKLFWVPAYVDFAGAVPDNDRPNV
ncbi:hypothetical protein CCHR01_18481 [Colletotrichum chrysophilum]|uniref:Uncharacterized protein n=1 Tax=Colletotrichum chrysophilum TaxID=1836956 RepID=A0AAD9A0G2_9PEZI|nr:hypothetical protein CCHR01_18481 [Colletotrichum chrysophilum]